MCGTCHRRRYGWRPGRCICVEEAKTGNAHMHRSTHAGTHTHTPHRTAPQHNTIKHSTTQHSTIQCNPTKRRGLQPASSCSPAVNPSPSPSVSINPWPIQRAAGQRLPFGSSLRLPVLFTPSGHPPWVPWKRGSPHFPAKLSKKLDCVTFSKVTKENNKMLAVTLLVWAQCGTSYEPGQAVWQLIWMRWRKKWLVQDKRRDKK